jgi:predicted nucleic acid-binding protein
MEPLNLESLPEKALLLIDSAPIICLLEGRAKLADRFRPLFAAHAEGRLRFAVTTITVQAASAVAINADALVTHDRDFSRLTSLRVMS